MMRQREVRGGGYGFCPVCKKVVHGVLVGSGHGVQNAWGFHEFDDLVCTNHGEYGEPMQPAREEAEEA